MGSYYTSTLDLAEAEARHLLDDFFDMAHKSGLNRIDISKYWSRGRGAAATRETARDQNSCCIAGLISLATAHRARWMTWHPFPSCPSRRGIPFRCICLRRGSVLLCFSSGQTGLLRR